MKMSLHQRTIIRAGIRKLADVLSVLGIVLLTIFCIHAQQPALSPTPPEIKLFSSEFISTDGLTIDRLIELGISKRNDLLAARQRMVIAEGNLLQARLRPNPTLETEYGSPRFLGGETESEFSVGVSQTLELGGKRARRISLAEVEFSKVRAEVLALERQMAVEIRTAYSNALASARQLDVLEKLISADEELIRITEARLKEGDVAPLDLNMVRVESNRLKVQLVQTKSEFETQLLQLKTLTGTAIAENIKLAPQPDRPPRFDTQLTELTDYALKQRADLHAARLAEQSGEARISLARANGVPNLAASVKYARSKEIIDFPSSIGGGISNKENTLVFGVSVGIPIFNRNQGEIASATGEKVQATKQREFLESTIRRDVAVAYRKYRAAAEAFVIYSTQILPRAEENFSSVRAAYGFGEFSIFDVVNEQRRLTENITGYNQSLRDYYTALAELETAIGTALPSSGFASKSQSVLPEVEPPSAQIDRERLLRSFEKFEFPKKNVVSDTKINKEQ